MTTLRFTTPLEDTPTTMADLLARAWPEGSPAQVAGAFERGLVELDGRPCRDPRRHPADALEVRAVLPQGDEPFGLPEAAELARGEGWILVDKPIGMPGALDRDDPMNPVLFMADMLGLDRATFTPAWSMPAGAGGPWLCGVTEADAERLEAAWRSGEMMLTFVALIPRVDMPRGSFEAPTGEAVTYSVTRYEGGLCEVQLTPTGAAALDPVTLMLDTLAGAGHPALGDVERGGVLARGGLRLRLTAAWHDPEGLGHSYNPPGSWWPADPVVSYEEKKPAAAAAAEAELAARREAGDVPELVVSEKTLEIMGQGHPWAIEDRDTGSRAHLPEGEVVRLRGARGTPGPFALAERGEVAARYWAEADDDEALELEPEIRFRVDEALLRRADLLRDAHRNDLYRLIHGEADGLPGVYVDRVGPLVRATVYGACARRLTPTIYEALTEHDPGLLILEVEHVKDVREAGGELPQARVARAGRSFLPEGERAVGMEDGLKYWCEPWEGIDVGFFADQRANRRALCAHAAPGQRWLNLFGHTGAFSVALAARGARVTNVDVSARYLSWTAENFALNGLDPALDVGAAEDARAFVAATRETYHGIIVDPPTAAQGKGAFWSVRRDYEELLTRCFALLEPGGVLLACKNDRKKRGGLAKTVRAAAKAAGVALARVEDAPPGHDYPSLDGFPEGDPFEGVLAWAKG
jgi:23S rRNA (cytosine1962-C5)-methyltransferase